MQTEKMKKNTKIILATALIAIVLFLNFSHARIGNLSPQTTQNDGFAVVELFTSEGCSSCPPADELMAKVRKQAAGRPVYLLAYHVDYWDGLGWKDTFSDAAFTDRQYRYAQWLGLQTVYTPQFVVNGRSEFAGDSKWTLDHKISGALEVKPLQQMALNAVIGATSLEISYKTDKVLKNTALLVAVIRKDAATNVKRGENSGLMLNHVQVVRELRIARAENKQGSLSFPKPEGFDASGWEIIGFVQNRLTGKITAAAKAGFIN